MVRAHLYFNRLRIEFAETLPSPFFSARRRNREHQRGACLASAPGPYKLFNPACSGEHGIPARIHEGLVNQFQDKFFQDDRFENLNLKPFSSIAFKLGEFTIMPVKIPHSPQHDNYGFVIQYRHRGRLLKIVIMTDFHNWDGLLDHFIDADFIYVEANHNPGLLRKHPNPNSHYHMKNENVADLLCNARKLSKRPPAAVMLGHLSKERNTHELALQTISCEFKNKSIALDFSLCVAPADDASPTIKIAG